MTSIPSTQTKSSNNADSGVDAITKRLKTLGIDLASLNRVDRSAVQLIISALLAFNLNPEGYNTNVRQLHVGINDAILALEFLGIHIVSPLDRIKNEEEIVRTAYAASHRFQLILDAFAKPLITVDLVKSSAASAASSSAGPLTKAAAAGTLTTADNVQPAVSSAIQDSQISLESPGVIASNSTSSNASGSPAPAASQTEALTLPNNRGVSVDGSQINAEVIKNLGNKAPTGFVCAACKAYNLVKGLDDGWYCVTRGRGQVGVIPGPWQSNVSALITKVPNAQCQRYSTEAEAVDAFNVALAKGAVQIL